MLLKGQKAREQEITAVDFLKTKFGSLAGNTPSAQFIGFGKQMQVIGIAGLDFESPFVSELLQDDRIFDIAVDYAKAGKNILISADIKMYVEENGKIDEVELAKDVRDYIEGAAKAAALWGGELNSKGELIIDPSTPAPGPHYYTNLLIGNRIGFDRPLQSTPKAAIDQLGRGCFRAHADTQVLATKWDYLPEENGFPANRQFYITENGKQIFYSCKASDESVEKITTVHSQNRTTITYILKDGLEIRRTIFILPSEDGMPLATEAQMIEIKNNGPKDRDLRIVYTGMFGTSEVHALREDVIFSTVVAQSEVFFDENNEIKAISFNPNPKWTKGNIRFATLMTTEFDKNGNKTGNVIFPTEYCARYSDFVGNGTLYNPQFIGFLSNKPSFKGPGFYALASSFKVQAGAYTRIDGFTCLSSDAVNPNFEDEVTMKQELTNLIEAYSDEKKLPSQFKFVCDFASGYSDYMKIKHEDSDFEAYVNNNLPFQVFYQTFVSRSLDWTQKGYREIGFREIQDIFASMYYFAGMGQTEFVKKLLTEWISNVFEDGYANHNFYWTGKEPGWWSDDALWLLQALDRYVSLTGDYAFLSSRIVMADYAEKAAEAKKNGVELADEYTRTVLNTIKAIITYSAKISVGKHGIPLIDRADWNDCLRVDPDCVGGAVKMEKYREQLGKSGKEFASVPFESEYSESVMNAFLLKVAIDAAYKMFSHEGDSEYASVLKNLSDKVKENASKYAWKNDFYARVLFNRSDKPELEYLGAAGDKLQVEDAPGSYFLNSFSWSVLAEVASESQIEAMLDSMDKYLKSPYGFRLCSTVDYSKIAPKIDVALYYPGDRENGGVFKHANMMAAAAMLKASKSVENEALAERLADTAYWVIDCILPYRTLKSPFKTCGNPRLCTQYNNCETGENIGPTLSGTSTWLLLCLFTCFGVEFTADSLICEPLLRKDETKLEVMVNSGKASYAIHVTKPEGFRRTKSGVSLKVDGNSIDGTKVPVFEDGKTHTVEVDF